MRKAKGKNHIGGVMSLHLSHEFWQRQYIYFKNTKLLFERSFCNLIGSWNKPFSKNCNACTSAFSRSESDISSFLFISGLALFSFSFACQPSSSCFDEVSTVDVVGLKLFLSPSDKNSFKTSGRTLCTWKFWKFCGAVQFQSLNFNPCGTMIAM